MDVPGRLVVGRVLRPHGLRGELSVEVLSDASERFSPGVELGAGDPDGPGPLAPVTIQAARLHQGRLLFEGAPAEVQNNLAVQEAYLGSPGEIDDIREAARNRSNRVRIRADADIERRQSSAA